MLVPTDEQPDKKRDFVFPTGVNLRECSVVIIGSTCQICGRDFKCITDVALHTQWRHNQIDGVLNSDLNRNDLTENRDDHAHQKCDICEEHLGLAADLKSYKRQINKKQTQEKRRARKFRLIIKIAGVTMTEIRLSRKYLKVHNSEYFADVSTQTEPHENEKHQDDCATDIDLSLANNRIVGDSRIHCIRPYKATNRYIDGKLASIQGDACSADASPETSPIDILNIPNADATLDATSSARYQREITCPRVRTADAFAPSLTDVIDVTGTRYETDSPRRSEQERVKTNHTAEDWSWFRPCDSSRDYPRESVICQQVQSIPGTTPTIRRVEKFIGNCWPKESRRHPAWSNKATGNRTLNKLIGTSRKPIETIIDNEGADKCNEDVNKRSTASSTRTNKEKRRMENNSETSKIDSSVDDDVQEILRITRGKVQSDINHESPNRTEREMLVRNAQMYVASTQPKIIYPDKNDAILVMNNSIDSRGCPPCVTIVNDDNCQFPANVATTIMCKTYNDKVNIYFNKHLNMEYYSSLPEINNNG